MINRRKFINYLFSIPFAAFLSKKTIFLTQFKKKIIYKKKFSKIWILDIDDIK